MGNICRSPTAEGVMRSLVRDAGLEGEIEIDSAGTGGWHVGEPPDPRATEAARRRGIVLEGRARQVRAEDFDRLDVPDPYYGGPDGFDRVLDLVEAACRGLLEHATRR